MCTQSAIGWCYKTQINLPTTTTTTEREKELAEKFYSTTQ
jgi:hypothetical protein